MIVIVDMRGHGRDTLPHEHALTTRGRSFKSWKRNMKLQKKNKPSAKHRISIICRHSF